MNILNIRNHMLNSSPFVRATGHQQATWLKLLMYCAMQENSGKIPRCSDWTDMEWLVAVGKRKADVDECCELWTFNANGDCIVNLYPLEDERKHLAQRAGGRLGNIRKSNKKQERTNASHLPPVTPPETVTESATGTPPVSIRKGKEMEGNETEEKEHARGASGDVSGPGEVAATGGPDVAGEGEEGATTYAEWPTREEWLAAADLQGLPRELAIQEWHLQESKTPDQRWRNIDRRRLQHHAARVMGYARQRGELGEKKSRPAPPPGGGNAGAAIAAMVAMSEHAKMACEYPADLKEAVKP